MDSVDNGLFLSALNLTVFDFYIISLQVCRIQYFGTKKLMDCWRVSMKLLLTIYLHVKKDNETWKIDIGKSDSGEESIDRESTRNEIVISYPGNAAAKGERRFPSSSLAPPAGYGICLDSSLSRWMWRIDLISSGFVQFASSASPVRLPRLHARPNLSIGAWRQWSPTMNRRNALFVCVTLLYL